NGAEIRLRNKSELPNKDFILTYDVAGGKIQDALMTHRDDRGGFFTFIMQPPERVTQEDVTPKELVFVLDVSGSMSGFPIEKAKEVIRLSLEGLYPRDTFNLITFAGATRVLFPEPVPGTTENIRKAQEFLATRQGGGGTEMMKAIRTALEPSDRQEHIRIVSFLTDGYVGNDMAILGEIQKHPNARVFSFGVGNSVNRFLLDKMAETSRGEVEYVTLKDDGSAAARRFHERVRNPLLTDISIDWGALPVADVYPKQTPDLFSAKPLVLSGRYN
ncbi:MAG: VWA domain-containing protein, partial [bacterium]|nr:VWA domain-containing protein [bacterium]